MNTTRKKAMDWLDNQIELRKELIESFSVGRGRVEAIDIGCVYNKEIHIVGVRTLAKALNYPLIKRIWVDGNKQCDANYAELYIYYKGYKVFELTDRDKGWNEK